MSEQEPNGEQGQEPDPTPKRRRSLLQLFEQLYAPVELASVYFSTPVAGPGGNRVGWVAGTDAEGIAYYPALALVALRKGKLETAHPVTLATRMVAAQPLGGEA